MRLADPGPLTDDQLSTWPVADGAAPRDQLPPEEPPPLPPELDPSIQWEPSQVRELLMVQGSALNLFLGAGSEDAWKYTRDDLAVIAPALCRIANRYPLSRAAAAAGDEIVLVSALGKYGFRSMLQRGQALAAAERDAEQAVRPRATVAPDGEMQPTGEPRRDVWTGDPIA